MKKWFFLLYLISHFARAEMVDTFEFKSSAERTRAVALAKSLRCPQCQNQNLVESNSPIAYDLRLEVYKMVEAGESNEQIIATMTERFGDFVRYNPPLKSTTLLLWGLPFVLLLLSVIAMWRMLRQRQKQGNHTAGLSACEQQALRELLAKTEQKQ
ncbi:heme lyase NrfEFG subunit NrfF [Avibacterium paragallinarum]|uniref:Formate-dependent nitrite reductase complex subunit n=1 Tax=Avibacterium paragallinarum TaxID=728 RepID=A0A0F5EYR2_AVIPA|nr:heme lyase NrfEFG subunit NrfF [Avibacterium paragallinarum]KAA6208387.1 heme lyase NrfEFG subunit NrfF [Avibacterium paragallinarum]KKB01743.1 cell shape determination protein CcmH [Avibacterium paragallinarum]RZN55513.1 heme lyase NrfEFG subunit NrfF [Avibacterium paragallinarum]RZN69408.1 heme lyase NrfEFG subunit NrfF [Avibacterium paragallinarum]SUU98367.1 Cytochrome c-type biogenesis protein CcmH precursor [Avibacterium paragallinarum]